MFNNYNYECSIILKEAEKICLQSSHSFVGSEHLLIALLKKSKDIKKIFNNYGIYRNNIEEALTNYYKVKKPRKSMPIYTPMLKSILLSVSLEAEKNDTLITPMHLLWGILESENSLGTIILKKMNIPLKKLTKEIAQNIPHRQKNNNDLEIYKIGKTLKNNKTNNCVVKREKELTKIMETLLKKEKSNPLLVGKAGCGKTAIVEELARLIDRKEVPEELLGIEIINLEMSSLLAGTKYRGEFEEKVQKIIKELTENKNIILFIDEIHSMVNAGGSEGAISASDILKPYLARGDIRIIGATTTEEYNEYIKKDKALCRRFDIISIEEPSLKDMETIMERVIPIYEEYYNICIPRPMAKELIKYADKYILNKSNPDKTINLLDAVCSKIKVKSISKKNNDYLLELEANKRKFIEEKRFKEALASASLINNYKKKIEERNMTKQDIEKTLEEITKIKVSKISKKEKQTLMYEIHNKTSIKENLTEELLAHENYTVFSVLDDETAFIKDVETLSMILERHFIVLDLENYETKESLINLIGKWQINENNYKLKELLENPYSTIIIKNYDKADVSVRHIIKKALKEKIIKNFKDEIISLANSLIFIIAKETNKQVGFGRTSPSFDDEYSIICDMTYYSKKESRKKLALRLDKC